MTGHDQPAASRIDPAGSSAGNGPGTKKAVCRQPESRHRLVLTVYEPRWHGFAKWRTEIRWPGVVAGVEWGERQHEGFLRRHGSGVLSRSFPSMRLSRSTSKRLARKEIEANG